MRLQSSDRVVKEWCASNGMELNIPKCNVISFTRKKSRVVHDYVVDNVSIQRVSVVKDLGVWLDEKLNYKHHMHVTISRANSVLSMVKRFAREFQDLYVLFVRDVSD